MNEAQYFSLNEWLAGDGGFEGDCPIRYSYKNPGLNEDKKLFNLVFREVRTGIETAFPGFVVGSQSWEIACVNGITVMM